MGRKGIQVPVLGAHAFTLEKLLTWNIYPMGDDHGCHLWHSARCSSWTHSSDVLLENGVIDRCMIWLVVLYSTISSAESGQKFQSMCHGLKIPYLASYI